MAHYQFIEWVERGQEAEARARIIERASAFPSIAHAVIHFALFYSPQMIRVVGMIDAVRRPWRMRKAA